MCGCIKVTLTATIDTNEFFSQSFFCCAQSVNCCNFSAVYSLILLAGTFEIILPLFMLAFFIANYLFCVPSDALCLYLFYFVYQFKANKLNVIKQMKSNNSVRSEWQRKLQWTYAKETSRELTIHNKWFIFNDVWMIFLWRKNKKWLERFDPKCKDTLLLSTND